MKATLKSGEALKADLLKLAEPHLRDFRCATHGAAPILNPTLSGYEIEWNITGCCDELVQRTRLALEDVRPFPPGTVIKGDRVIMRAVGSKRRRP